jgi:hypothetical protein
MSEELIFKYLGIGVFMLFLFYVASRVMKSQSTFIEGFINNDKISPRVLADSVKNTCSLVKDNTLLEKNRNDYEKIITNAYDITYHSIVNGIKEYTESITKDPYSKESQDKMSKLNTLQKHANVLEGALGYMDKN